MRRCASLKNIESSTRSIARATASRSISMPPSTDSSASGENGGRRSYPDATSGAGPAVSISGGFNDLAAAVEELANELEVVPGGGRPSRIAEQRGGMVRDHEWDALVTVHFAAELSKRRLGAREPLRGERADREDHLGRDDLDLPLEER